jgi:hypothetical protein
VSSNEHADNEASKPEATTRLCAAGAGGATTEKKYIAPAQSAPLTYGYVSNSSEVHRREVYLTSVQMELVMFTKILC